MSSTEKTAEILNDLIQINNDRIDGYKKAIEDTQAGDVDLKALFAHFVEQTEHFNKDLSSEVLKYTNEIETSNTISGKLHKTWLDIKANFSGHDRKSILEECERGEDASKKAYSDAVKESQNIDPEAASLISKQAIEQKAGHDKIRDLRDAEAVN